MKIIPAKFDQNPAGDLGGDALMTHDDARQTSHGNS